MIETLANSISGLTVIQWIIVSLFLFILFTRLLYLFLFTGKIIFSGKKESVINEQPVQPISLILTVRNEEDNLRNLLPKLLEIKNQKYEVIVVDDFSQDSSFSILGQFNKEYKHLKITSLNEETRFSVKLAQNIALKSAQNSWILVTPITAKNIEREWLESFAKNTSTNNRNLLVGYSGIETQPGIYNLLFRTENFIQQMRSAGFSLNGIPFVYSEDNVAFRKEEYFKLSGYASNMNEYYANFELLINKFMRKKETVFLFNQYSKLSKQTDTHKHNFKELLQKSFRIEKHLPAWKRGILKFEELTQLLYLPALAFVLLAAFPLWPAIISLAGLKIVAHFVINKIIIKRCNERKIFISSLVYGLLMPYYKLFYRWYFNRISRKHKWRNKA